MYKYVGGFEKVIDFNISFTNNVFCIVTTDAPERYESIRITVCTQNVEKSKITKSNFISNSVATGENNEIIGHMSFILAIGN